MTMYFPLVVHGALLIEPTETESKAALDQFIARAARPRRARARPAMPPRFHAAPRLTPAPPPRRDRGGAQARPALAPGPGAARGSRIVAVKTASYFFLFVDILIDSAETMADS